MAEIPRSWFSNPRPLPLDKDGRVDFSLDTENLIQKIRRLIEVRVRNILNPKERFMGRKFDEVKLPDGGRVILLYRWDENDPDLSLHDSNHNIFRLDKDGKVVWQVVRDEQGKLIWEEVFRQAEKYNEPGRACYPLGELWLEDESGRRFRDEAWRPGLKLISLGSGAHTYEIDVESGVAKNITPPHTRPW